jgi:hypothetical protein
MPFGFDDAFAAGGAALKLVPTLASVVKKLRGHKDPSVQKAIQIIKSDTLEQCKQFRKTLEELHIGLPDMHVDPKKTLRENRDSYNRLNFVARIRLNSLHTKLNSIHTGLASSTQDIAAIITCLGLDEAGAGAFDDAREVRGQLDAIARSEATVGEIIDVYKKILDGYIDDLSKP